jgi:GntR family transcriptional regulator
MLVDRYGIEPTTASQSIEPTVVDAYEAALLEVPVHTPALLFERVTRAADGRVVEFSRAIYRGDRYRIESELTLSVRAGGVKVTGISSNSAYGPEQPPFTPYSPA